MYRRCTIAHVYNSLRSETKTKESALGRHMTEREDTSEHCCDVISTDFGSLRA